MKRYVITSFARTPAGAFLGDLKEVPVQDLASLTIKEAVSRSGITAQEVQGVVLGHVMGTPEAANIARFALLQAGLDEATPGYTVNRICGSGKYRQHKPRVCPGVWMMWKS